MDGILIILIVVLYNSLSPGSYRIWEEWKISNNTFVAMMMKDGDVCGDRSRQVSVSRGDGLGTVVKQHNFVLC